MSNLLYTQERIIGGKKYTIRPLDVAMGRKVYARVQRYLQLFATEAQVTLGVSAMLMAGMSDNIGSDDDIDWLCMTFGPSTTVDFGDGRVLPLSNVGAQNELFMGSYEDQYEWLDACIEVNFKGIIEKLKGVLRKADVAAEVLKKA